METDTFSRSKRFSDVGDTRVVLDDGLIDG